MEKDKYSKEIELVETNVVKYENNIKKNLLNEYNIIEEKKLVLRKLKRLIYLLIICFIILFIVMFILIRKVKSNDLQNIKKINNDNDKNNNNNNINNNNYINKDKNKNNNDKNNISNNNNKNSNNNNNNQNNNNNNQNNNNNNQNNNNNNKNNNNNNKNNNNNNKNNNNNNNQNNNNNNQNNNNQNNNNNNNNNKNNNNNNNNNNKNEQKNTDIPKTNPEKKNEPPKPKRKRGFQLEEFQKYVKYAREGKLLYEENLVYSENPKISVVIALYNAEKFINATLKSVQNQRMKEIEIILVDDFSKDNSVKYVEEAQKKDPRISLYKNKKNMAVLYTKSIGVLKARGKYIFILDDDDLLLIDDLFDTIYEEIEKIQFDIVEFSWIDSSSFDLQERFINKKPYCNHPINSILLQPKLRKRFSRTDRGTFILQDRYVWGRIIKREVYVKSIEKIGELDLTRRVIIHDDTIITFMLFKYANSFKKIDKIGLVHFVFKDSASAESEKFATPERYRNTCLSFINYCELIFKHAENTTMSRQEVFWAFRTWIIRSKCKNYEPILQRNIDLARAIYNDPFVNNDDKRTVKNAFSSYIK